MRKGAVLTYEAGLLILVSLFALLLILAPQIFRLSGEALETVPEISLLRADTYITSDGDYVVVDIVMRNTGDYEAVVTRVIVEDGDGNRVVFMGDETSAIPPLTEKGFSLLAPRNPQISAGETVRIIVEYSYGDGSYSLTAIDVATILRG